MPDDADPELRIKRQHVWGLRYIDDYVLRDDDPGPTTGDFQRRGYIAMDVNVDANFNVIAAVDTSGVVQDRFHYDAYGTPKFLTATFADAADGGSDGLQHLYAGSPRDSKSRMYHVRYRYLHPTLGRWVTRDPIGSGARDASLRINRA